MIACLSVSSCGGPAVKTGTVVDPNEPRRLYPLAEGNVWAYDVNAGEDLPTLAVTRVVTADQNRYEVSSGGGAPIHYEVRPQGIFRTDQSIWLLKAPIEEGAHWPSSSGREATVVALSKKVSTTAGEFRDCVTVMEGEDKDRSIETTYCPDVGPVVVRSSMDLAESGQRVEIEARLRGYTVH